jgi:Flp pilus assembly protein CpaB
MARLQELTMNRGSRMLLILALAAGLVAAVLVFVALSQDEDNTATVSEGDSSATVVVASQNIGAGTEITSEMLKTIEVPEALLIAGAYTDATALVGQKVRVPILSGEQVPSSKVGAPNEGAGLSYVVPKGMRGLGVTIEQVTAVGGLLLSGDHVDVYAAYEDDDGNWRVYKILDNTEVLSVAQQAQEPLPAPTAAAEAQSQLSTAGQLPDDLDEQPSAATVTVSTNLAETILLVCAQESAARVWLGLRPFGDPVAPETVEIPPACQR